MVIRPILVRRFHDEEKGTENNILSGTHFLKWWYGMIKKYLAMEKFLTLS